MDIERSRHQARDPLHCQAIHVSADVHCVVVRATDVVFSVLGSNAVSFQWLRVLSISRNSNVDAIGALSGAVRNSTFCATSE